MAVEDHPLLDEERVAGPEPEEAGVCRGRGRCTDRARSAAQGEPRPDQRVVERAAREVGLHHGVGRRSDEDRRLERDRLTIGEPQPAEVDHRLAHRDPEVGCLCLG